MIIDRYNVGYGLSRSLVGLVRYYSSSVTKRRPDLLSILPKKKIINKLLFDFNSRLTYKKALPVLESIYKHLDIPEEIVLPNYVKGQDLMTLKSMLSGVRKVTNTIETNLVNLETELVEQAAEMGNNDAITILAFDTIQNSSSTKEDYRYATSLIKELTDMKHPLVFKMGGDLAFKKKYYEQAEYYWLDFLKVESDTIAAAQVYSNLGIYYFSYLRPRPNLTKAKLCFEKSIKLGELDEYTVRSHYYLGQLYAITEPQLSRYHLEIAACKALKESFLTLGFLEMNVFNNLNSAYEWFKLGVEASKDLTCMMGQFDCLIRLERFKDAASTLKTLNTISQQIKKLSGKGDLLADVKEHIMTNDALLKLFFDTRRNEVDLLRNL